MNEPVRELRSVAVENISAEVRERLLFYLYSKIIRESQKYKYLEARYGISARRWQNVFNRVQMPGIDMLSQIILDRPEYATWLLCGQALNGRHQQQLDPTLENGLKKGQIDLSIKGWEDKYDKIQEELYLKRFQNPDEANP